MDKCIMICVAAICNTGMKILLNEYFSENYAKDKI
jgi:hypothetical protein